MHSAACHRHDRVRSLKLEQGGRCGRPVQWRLSRAGVSGHGALLLPAVRARQRRAGGARAPGGGAGGAARQHALRRARVRATCAATVRAAVWPAEVQRGVRAPVVFETAPGHSGGVSAAVHPYTPSPLSRHTSVLPSRCAYEPAAGRARPRRWRSAPSASSWPCWRSCPSSPRTSCRRSCCACSRR